MQYIHMLQSNQLWDRYGEGQSVFGGETKIYTEGHGWS